MAKLAIKKASTDVTTYVFIQDSSKTTGEGLTGLAYNTASLVGYYVRPKGSATAITLATQTVTGDHSDGGFVEIDATNMPGVYRLDLPDAVCATGVPSVVVMLKGATNMSPVVLEIQLTDFDLNDASPNVTVADIATDAITAASVKAEAVTKIQNGLATSAALDTVDANVDSILADTGTDGVKLASTQGSITWGQQKIVADVAYQGALDIQNTNDNGAGKSTFGGWVGEYNYGVAVAGVYNQSEDGIGTLNDGYTFGVRNAGISGGMYNKATGVGSAAMFNDAQGTDGIGLKNVGEAQNVEGFDPAIATATKLQTVDDIVDTIKTKTDNLPATPASAGEYTSALTAIQNDLDNPSQYKADVSNLALQATSLAIKGQTDKIPAAPAQTGEYNAALAAIQSDLDNPNQYKADVSGLATQASVNAIPTTPLLAANYVAPDNAGIAAIKAKTDSLTFTTPNKVDASATVDPTGIATSAELEIVGGKVDGVLNKLNVSSVEFVTAVVGSTITILRGDTLSAQLLDLGDITQYASLDFTIKRVAGELDDAAKIRLRKNASGADDGLLRLNGAEHTSPTDGSIVIDDLTTGDIEIRLNANATSELVPGNYVYDIQLITANEVKTLTSGKCKVTADVTRATV